jgi:Flp pilus assembly pilin Flp
MPKADELELTTQNSRKEMLMFISALKAFWQEEDGQDMVEYALLLAFIALAAISLLSGAGTSIKGIFNTVNSTLTSANTAAS